MKFTELESLMSQHGVSSLADIARTLKTTPQAVSNWKARDQVPYRIVARLNQSTIADTPQSPDHPLAQQYTNHYLPITLDEGKISFFDILLIMAEQLKVIIIIPIITVFIVFTYTWTNNNQPYYESTAIILLPGNQAGGLGGLASALGPTTQATADLTNLSLFPELVTTYTFALRIFDEKFYVKKYQQELSLLAILTHGINEPVVGRDTLIISAMDAFQKMVTFDSEGSFSTLTVKAMEPVLARDINVKVLDELIKLNRYFKSQNVSETVKFIQSRITVVGEDLANSEQRLKVFREQNRQVSSPALQLEQERLSRDVDIQKGIFMTLKQQLELTNIEKIESETIVQVLDEPKVPLNASAGKNLGLGLSVLLAAVAGVGLGILLGFIRSYLNNSEIEERRKLRRMHNFLKKKSKDVILDRRFSAIISILLLIGSPYYLGHKSHNPVFFGMYSPKLMILNIIYVLAFITSLSFFIRLTRKKELP